MLCVLFGKNYFASVLQREQLVNNKNEINNSPGGPCFWFLYVLLSGLLNLYVEVRQNSLRLKILYESCLPKWFFNIEVRQKGSLLLQSANMIFLLLESAKGFFSIEVRQQDSLLLKSAKRILYYSCPPTGFFLLRSAKGFFTIEVRQKDSLLLRPFKQIMLNEWYIL